MLGDADLSTRATLLSVHFSVNWCKEPYPKNSFLREHKVRQGSSPSRPTSLFYLEGRDMSMANDVGSVASMEKQSGVYCGRIRVNRFDSHLNPSSNSLSYWRLRILVFIRNLKLFLNSMMRMAILWSLRPAGFMIPSVKECFEHLIKWCSADRWVSTLE